MHFFEEYILMTLRLIFNWKQDPGERALHLFYGQQGISHGANVNFALMNLKGRCDPATTAALNA